MAINNEPKNLSYHSWYLAAFLSNMATIAATLQLVASLILLPFASHATCGLLGSSALLEIVTFRYLTLYSLKKVETALGAIDVKNELYQSRERLFRFCCTNEEQVDRALSKKWFKKLNGLLPEFE